MCYAWFGAFPNHMHITIIAKKKQLAGKPKKRKETAQIGTNVRARVFNAELLARSQFASGRSCDRPSRSRFFVAFLGLRANAELVPKFYVALHASHAVLPSCSWGIWVREPYTEKKSRNCQTKKLKSGHGPPMGPGTKTNWPTDRRSQYNLNLKRRNYVS
jgi:hypothetical protein